MASQQLLFGIEYTHSAIRVTTSRGHRSLITGRFEEAAEWLSHIFYGVGAAPKDPVRGVISMPINLLREKGSEIAKAAKQNRFERVLTCSTCYSLAHSEALKNEVVVIHVTPDVSSVAIIGFERPSTQQGDFVRPIPGREAREIAVSLRCLLKPASADRRRRLIENVILGGDTETIARLGADKLEKELWTLGVIPRFIENVHAAAEGSLNIARRSQAQGWEKTSLI